MLLDEPFGALDALTRIEAQRLVERLWLERGFTAILVTHDVGEAVLLSDRVLVLDEGQIVKTFAVDLPRPRRRRDPAVAALTGQVLDAIFQQSSEASRPAFASETPLPDSAETPDSLSEPPPLGIAVAAAPTR
jgi:sulfonate transport system ATP-binding protein